MEGHYNTPLIALMYVEISSQAGEALLKNANYIYKFPAGYECPNGGIEIIGVLGNFGTHGTFISDYSSGMGILKIEDSEGNIIEEKKKVNQLWRHLELCGARLRLPPMKE